MKFFYFFSFKLKNLFFVINAKAREINGVKIISFEDGINSSNQLSIAKKINQIVELVPRSVNGQNVSVNRKRSSVAQVSPVGRPFIKSLIALI
jgi:hypothetical protein